MQLRRAGLTRGHGHLYNGAHHVQEVPNGSGVPRPCDYSPGLARVLATFVSGAVLISMAVLALSVVVAVSEKPAKGRREVVRLVAMIEAVIVLVYFTTSRMMMSVVVLLTMSVAVLISVTVIKAAALLALLALMAVSKQVAQGW
jgi:hypothetical protein